MRPHIRALAFTGDLFRILWIYFPSFVLPLVTLVCFLKLPQGYDLITRFTENRNQVISYYIGQMIWVFMTWYSARLIFYAYDAKQKEGVKPPFTTPGMARFFEELPRIIGIACWMVAAFIIACHAAFPVTRYQVEWWVLLACCLGIFAVVLLLTGMHRIRQLLDRFWVAIIIITVLAIVIGCGIRFFFPRMRVADVLLLSFIWSFIQLNLFVLFVSARRVRIEKAILRQSSDKKKAVFWLRIIRFFYIPPYELHAFQYYIVLFIIGLCVYICSFGCFTMAVWIGPLAIVVVAFGVLTAFGNTLTALNLKWRTNLHLLTFVWAVGLGFLCRKDHDVQLIRLQQSEIFSTRPDLKLELSRWMIRNKAAFEKNEREVPMFFVVADGGAIRSAYWTAGLLSRIEDQSGHRFSRQVFALSGASGGTVGNTVFYSLLYHHYVHRRNLNFFHETDTFLRSDFLAYPLATYFGGDFLRHLLPLFFLRDRAAALEYSFTRTYSSGAVGSVMNLPVSELFCDASANENLPILFMNTTRVQDGRPGVISSINLSFLPEDDRMDVLDSLGVWHDGGNDKQSNGSLDMRFATAAIMSSRFPFFSPAGCIGGSCFVDGGYFDNSGAGITQQAMQELVRIMAGEKDSVLRSHYSRVRFYVLHFSNSPQGVGRPRKLHPLVNGWFAPIITLANSFTSQTEINNNRLRQYVNELSPSQDGRWLEFDMYETDKGAVESINMNWAISNADMDKMRGRMDSLCIQKHIADLDTLMWK